MREFSWLAILLGVVIGAVLAAANVFVGLKVGMTISASIPAAVMSLLVLRRLLKRGTLLESNMVQTIGSAGESVAAGMIFVIPALFIMAAEEEIAAGPSMLEMCMWGALGGMLGVCFMIPLRRVLIVKEHGKLPFPEGVACAEVLQSGERGASGAVSVVWGAVVGGLFQFVQDLGFFGREAVTPVPESIRTQGRLEASPALLGVGYILGIRVAAYMLAGAALAWVVLIPGIAFFGGALTESVFPAKDGTLISAMSPEDLHESYIKYIGAGAVAIGGLISLIKTFPVIVSSIWHVIAGVFGRGGRDRSRENRDLPLTILFLLLAGMAYVMWQRGEVHLNLPGAIAVLACSFLFVTVSSRLVGIVGSSSNPASGMTIASLLGTALVFKFLFMGDGHSIDPTTLKVMCLSVGSLVCIAICTAGDCSQDLKTGFLVKATPYKQQLGEMIGVLTAVAAISGTILLLANTYGFAETVDTPDPLDAPQANIMKLVVSGVIEGDLPWVLVIMGGGIAVMVELLGLPALPFAVGLYLPLGLSTPIMVGGIIRWLIDRKKKEKAEHDPGILTASGLVAGTGIIGVGMAGVAALIGWMWNDPKWLSPLDAPGDAASYVVPADFVPWVWTKVGFLQTRWGLSEAWWEGLAIFPFVILTIWLWWCARKRPPLVFEKDTGPAIGPPQPIMSDGDDLPPGGSDDGGDLPPIPLAGENVPASGEGAECADDDEPPPDLPEDRPGDVVSAPQDPPVEASMGSTATAARPLGDIPPMSTEPSGIPEVPPMPEAQDAYDEDPYGMEDESNASDPSDVSTLSDEPAGMSTPDRSDERPQDAEMAGEHEAGAGTDIAEEDHNGDQDLLAGETSDEMTTAPVDEGDVGMFRLPEIPKPSVPAPLPPVPPPPPAMDFHPGPVDEHEDSSDEHEDSSDEPDVGPAHPRPTTKNPKWPPADPSAPRLPDEEEDQ